MPKRPTSTTHKPEPLPSTAKQLTPKQELFCQYYARGEDTFGNGVRSYQKAYDVSYETARASVARMLLNVAICARINELMDLTINDTIVDAELASVILQKHDLSAKIAAVKEFNAVRGRVTKKLHMSGGLGVAILKPDDETYKEIIKDEAKRLGIIK